MKIRNVSRTRRNSPNSTPRHYVGLSARSSSHKSNNFNFLELNNSIDSSPTPTNLQAPISQSLSTPLKLILLTKRSMQKQKQEAFATPPPMIHNIENKEEVFSLPMGERTNYSNNWKNVNHEQKCMHELRQQINEFQNKHLRLACVEHLYDLEKPELVKRELCNSFKTLLQKIKKIMRKPVERSTETLIQFVEKQNSRPEKLKINSEVKKLSIKQMVEDSNSSVILPLDSSRRTAIKTSGAHTHSQEHERVEVLQLIRENQKLKRLLAEKQAEGIKQKVIEDLRVQLSSIVAPRPSRSHQKGGQPAEESESKPQEQVDIMELVKSRLVYYKSKWEEQEDLNYRHRRKEEIYRSQIEELTTKVLQLSQEVSQLRGKNNQLREKALMQLEDLESYRLNCRSNLEITLLSKNSSRLHRENSNISRKASSGPSEKPGQHNVNAKVPELSEKNLKKEIFQINPTVQNKHVNRRRTACNQMSLLGPSMKRETDTIGLSLGSAKYEQRQKTNIHNISDEMSTELWRVCYFKPTFYQMIQDQPDTDKHETKDSSHRVSQYRNEDTLITRSFLQRIRVIMLCKLNEVRTVDPDRLSRFPEFVVKWFEKYDVDSEGVLIVKNSEEKSEAKQFYLKLMNPDQEQTWQITTFREFLLEQLLLQDLCFYLHYKQLLYRLSGITRQKELSSEICFPVETTAVQSILELLLNEFDTWNMEIIVSKIRQRVYSKSGVQVVDSGFVLRCLVEYYKIERVSRYSYINNIFKEVSSKGNGQISTYAQFDSVLAKLSSFGTELKAQLYRTCYSVGRSKITPQVFYAVCTQENIFVKMLRLKTFYKIPVQFGSPNKPEFQVSRISCIRPSFPYLYKAFAKIKPLLSGDSPLCRKIEQLGVYQHKLKLEKLLKYFTQAHNSPDSGLMRGRHFIHFMHEAVELLNLMNFIQLYDVLQQGEIKKRSNWSLEFDENEVGQLYLENLDSAIHIFESTRRMIEWKKRVQVFRMNCAARKIQRCVRVKFLQPLMRVYSSMYSRVREAISKTRKW